MKVKLLPFFFLICLLQSCITTKQYQGSKKLGKTLEQSEFLNRHFKGVIIKDLKENKIVFSLNGEKLFTPASNTKLLTFYMADQILPDSIPSIKYCFHNDTLFFKGLGDPTLLYPGFSEQPLVEFLKSGNRTIIYTHSINQDERYGPGWAWDDYPYYFQPEKSTLPIYGNCLWIKKDSLNITYKVIPKILAGNLKIEYSENQSFEVHRQETTNAFKISYDSLPKEIDECIPFLYSDSLAVKLLEDTLQKDITIHDDVHECINPQMLYSHPKDSLFKKLLVESDNFIAEQLLLSCSAYLFDTLSSKKTIQFTFDNFFREWEDSIRWVDGSGLSRYNAMSPALMIDILERIYHKNSWQRISSLFPAGGKEGTLDNFLFGEQPFIYAKSGSMTGIYNLSGYILTDKGNTMAFNFMNNNFNCSFKDLKTEIEKILRIIKRQY